MQFNADFTTYRRETNGTNRQYSASATITNGSAFKEPASGEMRAVLGLDAAVKAYTMLTEESNLQIEDKVVIAGVDHYVQAMEEIEVSGATWTRVVIIKKGT